MQNRYWRDMDAFKAAEKVLEEKKYENQLGKTLKKFQKKVIEWVVKYSVWEDRNQPRSKNKPECRKRPEAAYSQLFFPRKTQNGRKIWKKIYLRYISNEMKPRHKFIYRFADYKTLGWDIVLFFKYKKFPSLKCKEYRKSQLSWITESPLKSECEKYWKLLLPTIKKRNLPPTPIMPKLKQQLMSDLRSYGKYGYFISQLNEATRQILGNFNISSANIEITRIGNKKFKGFKKVIPADIWCEVVKFADRETTISIMGVCRAFYGFAQSYFNHEVVVTKHSACNLPPLLLKRAKKIQIGGYMSKSILDHVFRQLTPNRVESIKINPVNVEHYEDYLMKNNWIFPKVNEIEW